MKIKTNYFIVPLVTIAVAVLGSYFTSLGLNGWYERLSKPEWTPGGGFIGAMWTFLYILVTVVVLLFVNQYRENKNYRIVVSLFIVNAFLNASWSLVFFGLKLTGAAFFWIIFLNLTIAALIFFIWPVSKLLAAALAPYFIWVSVAGSLNYFIWIMN